MLGYALRRLLLVIPVVIGGVTVLFAAFFVLPGNTAEVLAGGGRGRSVSPTVQRNVEKAYGLDEPLYVQYVDYWKKVATGDLGRSYVTNRSVNEILKETAPASVRLAVWALIIEVILGVLTGIVAAIRKYSLVDALATLATTMALALPVFVLGYLLVYVFSIYVFQHNLPAWMQLEPEGIGDNSWTLLVVPAGDQWRYLIMPAVTLALVGTATVARLTRSTMLEESEADYVRTARAKGAPERTVVFKHTLRNALVPVVTLIGLDLGALIGSAVVTETVFNWPGMGSELARAAQGRDAPVVLGLTIVLIVIYVVINLLVDLSYGFLDPRIRSDD
jgi:oligopeptide transport system permease protein